MEPDDASQVLPPGTVLAHYRIGTVLGSGAMGTVYLAHDLGLDRGVAVKVLKPGVASDPRAVERFFREARAAARVTHENLAHVYFVGSEGTQRFFAMEHVPGESLEQRVRRGGRLALEDAVDVLLQAARGLGAAHAAGIVHRDVKPSNVLLTPEGRVKVTDFGLARSIEGDVEASGAGAVHGTPSYMSPEQLRGEGVDARSDVYALGIMAFTLFAGHPPFEGPTLGKVLSDQLNAPLPSLQAEVPDLPPAVDEVLARLCAKEPARRPASMEHVADLLAGLRPRRIARAPFAARAAAFVIDVLFVGTAWAALQFLATMILGDVSEDLGWAFEHLAWAASQLGTELWRQTTPGKWLLHLAVVREDGLRPSPRALVARYLVRAPQGGVALLMVLRILPWAQADHVAALVALTAGSVCWGFARGRTLSDVLTRTTVAYRHPPP